MKTLVIILTVAVLGLGFWLISRDSSRSDGTEAISDSPDSTEKASSVDTDIITERNVEYTSSGFSPSTLSIKAGETVIFTNNSSRQMWVASNPHPIHTDFSDFDDRKGVSSGNTYSFTFDKAGTYSYHNHLRSNDTGKIVVE